MTSALPGYVALADVADDQREAALPNTHEAAYPEIFDTYPSAWGLRGRVDGSATASYTDTWRSSPRATC